jgi:HAD superfamily hydrolase (TIGR01484 family)
MNYKAVMFDFDGTVTEKGRPVPSEKMARTIIAVAKKVPVAFCTGRQLKSFKEHGVLEFLKYLRKDEISSFLNNLFLISENGAIGYFYNQKQHKFAPFYRGKWPEKFIKRKTFRIKWGNKIKKFAEFLTHKIIVVTVIKNHSNLPINQVYAASDKLYKMCHEFFRELSPSYEKYLHIGNSGLGVLVGPADWDKDGGIKRFASFLSKKRGIKFSKNAKEILVVGDSAKKSGNDYYFLRGDYGTPFTVGSHDKSKKLPNMVIGRDGKKLLHEKGTRFLLEKYFLRG